MNPLVSRIEKAKVLVVVKAYPNPSRKYQETVCTAGLLNGEQWIRIYPVPYRLLSNENQYPKYGWIELDLERRTGKDFRPESFRLLRGEQEEITLLDKISASPMGWEERKRYVLQNVYRSMQELIDTAYDKSIGTSIAVVKPLEILDVCSSPNDNYEPEKANPRVPDLFSSQEENSAFKTVKQLPYKFYYQFKTTDGKIRRMMVEDWEIGALYWNCYYRHRIEETAIEKVKEKLWKLAQTTDLHLIVGTTLRNHQKGAPNPFVIIGLFYPPVVPQMCFDFG